MGICVIMLIRGENFMENPVFRRKIYKEILEWKEERSEKYALLIKGARRVGKSTIVEEFAKKEFKSYILIDFAHTSKEITGLFDDMYNLDFFFLQLQQFTGVRLYEKESVIIFDEVQLFRGQDRLLSILWQTEDISILRQARFCP